MEPEHSIAITQMLLDASKREGTVEVAPEWMGGVIAYGVHHPFAVMCHWVDGQHYSAYQPMITSLKAQGRIDEATSLLRRIIAGIEREPGYVPSWFAEQLVGIYMKTERWADALAVCESYEAATKGHGTGARLIAQAVRCRAKLARGKP